MSGTKQNQTQNQPQNQPQQKKPRQLDPQPSTHPEKEDDADRVSIPEDTEQRIAVETKRTEATADMSDMSDTSAPSPDPWDEPDPVPADDVSRGAFSFSCLLYTSPSPRDYAASRMPSSA